MDERWYYKIRGDEIRSDQIRSDFTREQSAESSQVFHSFGKSFSVSPSPSPQSQLFHSKPMRGFSGVCILQYMFPREISPASNDDRTWRKKSLPSGGYAGEEIWYYPVLLPLYINTQIYRELSQGLGDKFLLFSIQYEIIQRCLSSSRGKSCLCASHSEHRTFF